MPINTGRSAIDLASLALRDLHDACEYGFDLDNAATKRPQASTLQPHPRASMLQPAKVIRQDAEGGDSILLKLRR